MPGVAWGQPDIWLWGINVVPGDRSRSGPCWPLLPPAQEMGNPAQGMGVSLSPGRPSQLPPLTLLLCDSPMSPVPAVLVPAPWGAGDAGTLAGCQLHQARLMAPCAPPVTVTVAPLLPAKAMKALGLALMGPRGR